MIYAEKRIRSTFIQLPMFVQHSGIFYKILPSIHCVDGLTSDISINVIVIVNITFCIENTMVFDELSWIIMALNYFVIRKKMFVEMHITGHKHKHV